MKLLLQFAVVLLLLVSCSGRKQIERNLHSGNYDRAIYDALDRLKNNKEAKRKQDFIALLADAFIKAEERDLDAIDHLKKDGNPEHYLTIYKIYARLDKRQEDIKPLMPLTYRGKPLKLRFSDYDSQLIDYRAKSSAYLYDKGLDLLENEDKYINREAYTIFELIEEINPNYRDVKSLMDEAYSKGLDHILLSIENDTYQIIPRRLEQNLLNFDSYGLNDFWTAYHSNNNQDVDFDYGLNLNLYRINISPERILERQITRQAEVVDGTEYEYDEHGNIAQDSLGNEIKVDKIIKVRARLLEYEQVKSTQILANVNFVDYRNNELLKSYPLESEFVFSNLYATFRGDERALSIDDKKLIRNRQVYFPSNEQMVYDTGEELKIRLKNIIKSHSFSQAHN